MIIKYLHLRGFTSYIDSEINFNTEDTFISTIIAPNGSGKSSILEAITTALFYRARGVDNRGTGMDDLINNTCNFFEITFIFEMENNEYKIIRRKFKNGKHELEFYINNISQTEKIAETQEKINNTIKMNYETFLDTICIGQGMSGNFMAKKPNERKDIFIEILNLNQFEVLEKYTKELKKDLNLKLELKNNELNKLNESFNNEDLYKTNIDKNNLKLSNLENDINNKQIELDNIRKDKAVYETLLNQNNKLINYKNNIINSINNDKNKLNVLKNKYLKTKEEIENNKNEILQYNNDLENIVINSIDIEENNKNKINLTIDNILKQKSELISNTTENQTKIKILEDKIRQINIKYNNLLNYDKAECNFCGNKITKEHKEKHLNDLKEKIDNCNNEIKLYENNIEKINGQLSHIKNEFNENKQNLKIIESNIKEINNNLIKKEKINSNINSLNISIKNLKDNLINIKKEKNEIDNELKELNKQYEEYKDIKEIEKKEFNDFNLEKELLILNNEKQNLISSNAIFNNKLKEIEDDKKNYKILEKDINDIKIKISDYESLIEAFGKKGIQANIIANVLPDIEEEINNILNILFNNSTTIEFITQKDDMKSKVKSSASLETLDIVIHDKDKDRTYATYSGGEKFRIDFAFHIGLSKFLAKRAKSNIEFFMIDEGLGSQDEEGKENFILTINKISNMFKQIFIITHIDELKDAFDKKIIINKDPINGSKIEMA